jgi:hypothetical protein
VRSMSGFARRYFVLHQSGLLEYSFEPGQPARDQIFLPQAAIATTPGHKDIHLDGSTAMFHVKCLTEDDFKKWMAAFRCAPLSREPDWLEPKLFLVRSSPHLMATRNDPCQCEICLVSMVKLIVLSKRWEQCVPASIGFLYILITVAQTLADMEDALQSFSQSQDEVKELKKREKLGGSKFHLFKKGARVYPFTNVGEAHACHT